MRNRARLPSRPQGAEGAFLHKTHLQRRVVQWFLVMAGQCKDLRRDWDKMLVQGAGGPMARPTRAAEDGVDLPHDNREARPVFWKRSRSCKLAAHIADGRWR